jgi:hypothetical protein
MCLSVNARPILHKVQELNLVLYVFSHSLTFAVSSGRRFCGLIW